MKEKRKKRTMRGKSVRYRYVGSVVLVLALLFDLFMLSAVFALYNEGADGSAAQEKTFFNTIGLSAEVAYGITLCLLGLFEALRFFHRRVTAEYAKKDYVLIGYAVVYALAGILSFCAARSVDLVVGATAIYFGVGILQCILHAVAHRKRARSVLLDVLFILLLAILLLISLLGKEVKGGSMIFSGVTIFLIALVNICKMALSNFNNQALKKVIRKTYAGEVLFGLLLLVVAFSLVLMNVETSIHSFSDGLWYCFMLVTTIGFGDLTSTTLIGRALSVILGAYGIVVVAIVTSIIVNFYNEVKDHRDEESDYRDEESVPEEETRKEEIKEKTLVSPDEEPKE